MRLSRPQIPHLMVAPLQVYLLTLVFMRAQSTVVYWRREYILCTVHVTDDETENQPPINTAYETTPAFSHPPRIDLQRFQKLIEQEELSTIASASSPPMVSDQAGTSNCTPSKVDTAVQATNTEDSAHVKIGEFYSLF